MNPKKVIASIIAATSLLYLVHVGRNAFISGHYPQYFGEAAVLFAVLTLAVTVLRYKRFKVD